MSKHSHHHEDSPGIKGADTPNSGNGTGGTDESRAAREESAGGKVNPKESPAENQNAETPAAGTPGARIAELENSGQKYAELEIKLAELNDQYLRKAADFENFRKRMNREKQEITEFANLNLLLDLLPVIDDFERAIKSAETSKDFASFYEGITMIEKRLSSQLESKWGLKRFDSEGKLFDPNLHEALQMEKAAGISEPVVKEDYVKGYYLREKVIRFAKVKVLMPEGGAPAEEAPPAGQP